MRNPFKSRYLTTLAVLGVTMAFVFWPRDWMQTDSLKPLSGVALSLKLVQDQCVVEFKEFALQNDLDWADGAVDNYCLCVATNLLLHLKSEEEIRDTAEVLLNQREVFRGFIRLESIANECLPNSDIK